MSDDTSNHSNSEVKVSHEMLELIYSQTFRGKLAALLNAESAENHSNTPDFILASYLLDCLNIFDRAVNARDRWYGVAHKPGEQLKDETGIEENS